MAAQTILRNTARIVPRRSAERGYANHVWLDTYHTFSFANYFDAKFSQFGALRVINEDTVSPSNGFGKHPHREFEIFSYILSGELGHDDSMGNKEVLKRGDVQFTTAGSGISHAEQNASNKDPVNFLQIWVKPDAEYARIAPAYHTKTFPDSTKLGVLRKIISPSTGISPSSYDATTIGIHTDLYMYASLLEKTQKVTHVIQPNATADESKQRQVYVHVTNAGGAVSINDGQEVLQPGDGAFVTSVKTGDEISFESVGDKTAEFLVFDMISQ